MPPNSSRKKIPEFAKEPHKLSANTHRLMENYKDDYESHAKGIFQEAIQNSIDAKKTDYTDVKITIRYDPEKRILSIRDYGTTGMPHCKKCYWGRIAHKDDCHEENCNWGNFHYLGGLGKPLGSLGSRGQGKSLLIVAGSKTIVRTKIASVRNLDMTETMASEWARSGDDWTWILSEDNLMKPDEPEGSEIIIEGIIDNVHNDLLKSENIINDISKTWCAAIKKGVQIRFGYAGKELQKIGMPHFPKAEIADGKPIMKKISKIPVTFNRKKVGELTDITIYLADEPVPPELRGIALIKKGTQVITREREFGRKISTELQDRIYGWASYDCNYPNRFLCACEKPGHRGFTADTIYIKVQDLLQSTVEDFLLPFEKQRFKPHLTEKDLKRARLNLEVLQKAFEEVPDFNPWSGSDDITRKRERKEFPNYPYISDIKLDKEFYDYDDIAHVEITILNPTKDWQRYLHLTIEALDKGLSQLEVWEYPPHVIPMLNPAIEEKKGRIVFKCDLPIIDDFGIGKNFLRCILSERPPRNDDATKTVDREYSRASHSIWVGIEPIPIKRGPPTGGHKGDDGKKGTIRDLAPITDESLDPIQNEIMPIWSEGDIWFYTKGARMRIVYDTQQRAADSVLYELVAEAIAERRIKDFIGMNPQNTFDKEQVLQQFKNIEDLRKRFLRSCEKLRATSRD